VSSCGDTDGGALPMAFSVAKLTAATTPSTALSFISARLAHAAHVIPRIESVISLSAGDGAVPVTEDDDIQPCLPAGTSGQRATVSECQRTRRHAPACGKDDGTPAAPPESTQPRMTGAT